MHPTQRDTPPSVLRRASDILSALDAGHPVRSLADLSRTTGLPRSTTHGMCAELVELGLLERVDGGYRLGLRLFELGELVPRQRGLRETALPYMEDLRAATGATVHLGVLEGVEVVYLQILRTPGGPRLPSRIGGRLPPTPPAWARRCSPTPPPRWWPPGSPPVCRP
ncbi:helix-turn-helix domain-containing protein [Arsenicicoccus piscis]|nr:helix-turn-helix domain-containing protein [Arsenicicoccus piscis]MCH8626443.1 helix-turn-helix domain-containing protein [Arsenicicoccus piscis]